MTALPYKSSPGIGFGIYERLPELPAGWIWRQSPHDFLFVESPTGRVFYADFPNDKPAAQCTFADVILGERKTATRWDWIRTFGKLRVGHFYRANPQ